MSKKELKQLPKQNWRPTEEDGKLLVELQKKLGVSKTDIIRLGLRKLAASEART